MTTARVAGVGRVRLDAGHVHQGLEDGLKLVARRVREVSDECRSKAHRAVGTDGTSPSYDPSRHTFTGTLKWELKRRAKRSVIRRSGQAQHVANVRRFRRYKKGRGLGSALAMSVVRRPLSMLRTLFWMLVLLALLLGLIWAALAPVRHELGKIIPGIYPASERCERERPMGGVRGAAWEAGNQVRSLTSSDVDAEAMRDTMRAGATLAGQAWGTFRASVQGVADRPMEQVPADSFAPVAGCTGPCFVAPAPLPAGSEGIDQMAQAVVAAGETGQDAVDLVATGMAESSGDRTAANPSSSARGYWQLLTKTHGITEAQAFDPAFAARFAVGLRDASPKGLAGPWAETYGKGLHEPHVAAARAAVERAQAAVETPAQAVATPVVQTAATCAPGGPGAVRQASSDGARGPQGPAGQNGRLDRSTLFPLTWAPGHVLRQDAAQAAEALNDGYRAAFGQDISVTDSYRTLAEQVSLKDRKPRLAAVPGTSNHGWGVALDLGGGVQTFGSRQHAWMEANASQYGWVLPDWARAGGSKPEPWHWEYVGLPGQAA